MKAIKFFAALFMMFAVSASVNAQELSKANQKLLKKQLKEFKSEGWKVNPGQLPLETQLTKAFACQSEVDAMGYEVWIVGEGRSTGSVYDAARTQAMTVAKGEIATKLRTDMTSTIEQDLANEQFGADEAESIAKTLQVTECCVTLVAMVDIFLNAELLQQQHTTDTQQDFLLQAVLPVATIE